MILSVEEPLGTVTVFAIGRVSFQVFAVCPRENAWPGRPICTSYVVFGSRCTRLPRHSLLRESYHMARPGIQVPAPCLRNCTWQPAEPGFVPGVQYRPIEW